MTRDPWKLVTDEAQLRAGMTVEVRPCNWCGKTERYIVARIDFDDEIPCAECLRLSGINAIGSCHDYIAHCMCRAIPERRLYALIDDDTAADETTVTRRREMVE